MYSGTRSYKSDVRSRTGVVSQGHEVLYYSYNMLKEKIEATGAKFISCDDYNMEEKLSPADSVRIGKDLAFSTKILVDTTLALDEMVCEEMGKMRPDCIVADSMAIWGKCVAMKLGICYICSRKYFVLEVFYMRTYADIQG